MLEPVEKHKCENDHENNALLTYELTGHDFSHSKLRFTSSTMRVAWKFPRRNIGDAKRLEEGT